MQCGAHIAPIPADPQVFCLIPKQPLLLVLALVLPLIIIYLLLLLLIIIKYLLIKCPRQRLVVIIQLCVIWAALIPG
jgi:hypothetical protein